jgi:hypothetical protein
MFCWLTHKLRRNFVITVCFTSVISVFSVANAPVHSQPGRSGKAAEAGTSRGTDGWALP